MTPEEYKSLRLSLGLTQAGLSAILGVSRKTVNFRESGLAKISKEARLSILSIKKKRR
jgi:DNA-binding XRE family transcriptional regulator